MADQLYDAIVFLPGHPGSILWLNGEEVWPPTLEEILLGYHRLAQLVDPNVTVGGIIPNIWLKQVYKPIADDLSYIAAQTGAQYVEFPYDWRQDISTIVPLLAARLQQVYAAGAQSIALVCHSMGGMIVRLLLENPPEPLPDWFSAVTLVVGICNPHHGAPKVLAMGLGILGDLGIAGDDLAALCADPRYPAAYQGFPAPHYNRLRHQPGNKPLIIYKHKVADQFHLSRDNLGAASKSFGALDMDHKPPGVDYVLIAGSNHSTIERIDYDGANLTPEFDNVGDGTVPLWSAAPGPMSAFVFDGDHLGVMSSGPFRDRLFQTLTGADLRVPPFSDKPVVTVSVNQIVYAPGEAMTILIVPDKPVSELSGALIISRAKDVSGGPLALYGDKVPISYQGPVVSRIGPLLAKAPADIGAYRMTFEGDHVTTDETAATFVVSQTGGSKGRRGN